MVATKTNETGTPTRETRFLGRVPYEEGLRIQEARVEELRRRRRGEALFLLEHDPVLTLGSGAHRDHVRARREELDRLGLSVHETSRGGDVTYHGPGQLVGYPILDLERRTKDLGRYLRDLEEVLIRTLDHYGVRGEREPGLTGVWVRSRKIAAIGVRVSRWITSHGFALNVATDPRHWAAIVPCGIADRGVVDLADFVSPAPSVAEIAKVTARCFAAVFADGETS